MSRQALSVARILMKGKQLTQNSWLRAAINHHLESARENRAIRAQRARLESDLRNYRSDSERAEMDAILSRHAESETHEVWHSMSSRGALATA